MKRVLAAVACGSSLHLAPSHASGGWGGAGSTGTSGVWPPNGLPQGAPAEQPPVDPANYYNINLPPDNLNAPASAATATSYHDPSTYHQQQRQQQQQQPQPPPPPYGSPYIPQQSRWAGQQYTNSPIQQQQQHVHGHGQGLFPQQHERYPPPPGDGSGGVGEPLHLGTKWRNLVSRVKDAVRPGQPPPTGYGQNTGGYYAGHASIGGWAESGEGGGGYSPPGSSWVDGVNQNTGYNYAPGANGGQPQQDLNVGYGGSQQQQQQQQHLRFPPPAAAASSGFDPSREVAQQGEYPLDGSGTPAAASFDNRQGQQHSTPSSPAFFVLPGFTPQPPGPQRDGGADLSHPSSAVSAAAPQQEKQQVPYGTDGINNEYSGGTRGGLSSQDRSFEPSQAGAAVIGQGWLPPVVEAAPAIQGLPATSGEDPAAGSALSDPPLTRNSTQTHFDGVPSSGSTVVAASPGADIAAVATSSENHAGRSERVSDAEALGSSSSSSISVRSNEGDVALDIMPSSADHGMERVDWGKGAEEEEDEEMMEKSGETVEVPGTEEGLKLEREEKALIRELERMDSGIGMDPLGIGSDSRGVCGNILLPSPSPPPSEYQTAIDEAVEHQLEDLLDSIIIDDDDCEMDNVDAVVAEDGEYIPAEDGRSPASEAAAAGAVLGERWSTFYGGEAEATRKHPVEPTREANSVNLASPPLHGDNSSPTAASEPAARAQEGESPQEGAAAAATSTNTVAGAEEGEGAAAAAADAMILPNVDTGAGSGSLWGKTRRWETLPPQPKVVISDSGEEEAQEFEDERAEIDVRVPLDPIELPPSAATDEIWNDQHLQDQLDAYWEQSRRGRAAAAATSGGGQQLSAYRGVEPHLQPTYGPGDWVGKGGGTALLPKPLPDAAADGAAGSGGWVAAPRLFEGGNQAPINIFGDVHVHLQQGRAQDDGERRQQQRQQEQRRPSPSSELSARERYYSQGETSWSGSERGGQ